jgi:Ca2+-binding EF-hand superfamily protein
MPPKSEKTENTISGFRTGKKQIINKINDITERTQRIVLEKFTDEQLTEFRELFNMFDKDNQG